MATVSHFQFRDFIADLLGPAGLSAAIRLKQFANEVGNEDFRVLLLEKAGEIGAHILSENVIEPSAVNELISDWSSPDNPSRFENALTLPRALDDPYPNPKCVSFASCTCCKHSCIQE